MTLSTEITTVYNSTFVPFDLYIVIFMATLMFSWSINRYQGQQQDFFLRQSRCYYRFFSTYATFVLGRTESINLITLTGQEHAIHQFEILMWFIP